MAQNACHIFTNMKERFKIRKENTPISRDSTKGINHAVTSKPLCSIKYFCLDNIHSIHIIYYLTFGPNRPQSCSWHNGEGGGWSTFKWLSYNLSFDSSLIASWIQSCPTSVCKQLPVPLSVGPDIHLSRRTDQAWRHALLERRHWLHLGVPTPLCVKGKKGGAVNSIALLIICWDSYNQMRPSSSSIIKKKTSHDPRIKLHHKLHQTSWSNPGELSTTFMVWRGF